MNITLTDQKAERALAYREHATMDNLVEVMDRGLNAVHSHLNALGIQPAGPPYAAYLNTVEDETFAEFDLELGFPVAQDIPLKEGLFMSETYGGKAVTATHKGPYNTLETAYVAVMDYIGQNGLEPTGVYYDYYLNNPDDTAAEELLTKVVIPVK